MRIRLINNKTGEERVYNSVKYFKENRYLIYITEVFPNFGTPPTDIFDKKDWSYESIPDEE